MAQEQTFHQILLSLGIFGVPDVMTYIPHPTLPSIFLEVDNLAQKGNTLFVFEGKFKNFQKAISQLQERYRSLQLFRQYLITKKHYQKYDFIRLFYYSLKEKELIEFDSKGNRLRSSKFTDHGKLKEILRNL